MSAKQEWVKTLITAFKDRANIEQAEAFYGEYYYSSPIVAQRSGNYNWAIWYEQLGIAFSETISGDDNSTVIKFTHPDGCVCYIDFRGYYSSYDGPEYEDCYLVEPVQKVVTVYEERAVL